MKPCGHRSNHDVIAIMMSICVLSASLAKLETCCQLIASFREQTQQRTLFGGSDRALYATVIHCTGGYIVTHAVDVCSADLSRNREVHQMSKERHHQTFIMLSNFMYRLRKSHGSLMLVLHAQQSYRHIIGSHLHKMKRTVTIPFSIIAWKCSAWTMPQSP
ncbi:uncharacterized protein HD556DRAFT_1369132 [Suillus plorans]|uniref:Secreted protein n=1 Tax=Suillus plorans TaxID=116603 RepID=A0A9P7AQY6_9AGAM|nr:uncharacterized protein HD556DRAFT_1369132 [Suillus plorans]KAG1794663.1 hypothetical protein HD556DRAFT_1369132 [Suillus plorans]